MRRLRGLLLWFARTRLAGTLIRLGFAYMSFVIPVQRLRETNTLLAFYHPSPSYPVHILLVPKRAYRSLLDIPEDDSLFLRDLVATVQSLVQELGLAESGYRLITNGGAYQDVPVLHFHLIAGKGRDV
jgi:histidine triad (HIT) family protein